jgi:hypothetical protein
MLPQVIGFEKCAVLFKTEGDLFTFANSEPKQVEKRIKEIAFAYDLFLDEN